MTRSLQTRLLLGLAAGTAIVLIAAGVILYLLIRAALIAEFDAALAGEARSLATLVEQQDGRIQTEMAEHGVPRLEAADRPLYYQLTSPDGAVIERSSRLGPNELEPFAGTAAQPATRFVTLPGDRSGRMVGIRFVPVQPQHGGADRQVEAASMSPADVTSREVTLVVARDTQPLDRTLNRIAAMLAAVFGGAVLLSLLVSAPIVRAGLQPLKTTASRIESLDSRKLSERLDASHAPAEVQSVIACLNALLDRLDDAFQRERAFSANVAHELRTPLAGLRSTLEVTLSRPREAADYQRALTNCLAICQQTQVVVDNLLSLARIDAGQCEVRRRPVQLDDLLRETWATFAPRAESRGLQVTWDVADELCAVTDPDRLRLILKNLFDNAVTYGDTGGTVRIAAHRGDGEVEITVANSGSRLSQQQTNDAFERFWRGDASRSATGTHAGLGLSLCREMAGLLDISIAVASECSGMFQVRLGIVSPQDVPERCGELVDSRGNCA